MKKVREQRPYFKQSNKISMFVLAASKIASF
jgi:hypothetical protein